LGDERVSLWTPGGEHPVDREPAPGSQAPGAPGGPPDDDPLAGLSDEDRARAEAMVEEVAEVRRQLAEVPAAVVVANHVMGLYELGAIHLASQPPNLEQARVAIDAMGAVVERLAGRLGDNEPTLVEALAQLQLVYVRLKGTADAPAATAGGADGSDSLASPREDAVRETADTTPDADAAGAGADETGP
jgi:hypothetical protein